MADFNNSDFDEKDDFWDIDKLLPKKRSSLSPFSSYSPVREVELSDVSSSTTDEDGESKEVNEEPSERTNRTAEDRKLSFVGGKGVKTSVDTSYEMHSGSLIKKVTVRQFIDRYDFYDNFRKAALIYHDYKTEKCEFVEFYSYMPQYSQLSSAAKGYYFYWRSELRRGRFLKTDYSYLNLYVYEILNLPDKIPPEQGIKILCRLWREYRKALPRIDQYFSVWVQDYCLVHRLPCPVEELRDFIFDVISVSNFKEFYLSDIDHAGEGAVDSMLAYLSDYDWRKGKFVNGNPDRDQQKDDLALKFGGEDFNSPEVYKKHMRSAMYVLMKNVWSSCVQDGCSSVAVVKRDAFPNSLCTHMVKRKLEIEYYPVSEADGLRRGVTAAVRYTENKLRAIIGVKSRLAIKDLPDSYRKILDDYFDDVFENERRVRARASAPEYERLYEAPDEKLSFEGADEIERASWNTTIRLVDTEDPECAPTLVLTEDESVKSAKKEETLCESAPTIDQAETYGLDMDAVEYLANLFGGDFGIEDYVLPAGVVEDSLAETINEAFSDGFGDIILEFDGEKYTIIEDYEKEIAQWLRKLLK